MPNVTTVAPRPELLTQTDHPHPVELELEAVTRYLEGLIDELEEAMLDVGAEQAAHLARVAGCIYTAKGAVVAAMATAHGYLERL